MLIISCGAAMSLKEFKIEFNGYWREENKAWLPAESGIYCVYTCAYHPDLKEVTISKLVYVGAAENVNEKIANHEKLAEWQSYLNYAEQLCYTFAAVPRPERARCVAAIIFTHRPPANSDYLDRFPFERTILSLTGCTR